ncbi:acetyl-CoA carboxylase biotin carboxyl carrier protein subunit [Kineosporia sp. NBRC 101677]|uniref:acyl-CoA carboxylase subunit epsilon n=1 Tax=Kineosporia TaxID=49184 RepID=UPI0024A2541B|nr:acyl-CoA carboxylase subunit epsilon [Kineosporia sp. NBRC 101677]GLY13045.1 acetyl-CoA carboxylase biotin carboxyl carrier protein subunit [Kineosporia sp. NBRC 101677]
MPEDEGGRPALHLVRGDASAEEIAALLAVISAVGSATEDEGAPGKRSGSAWADRGSLLRRPVSPGPGAWRASGRTR